MAPRVRGKTSLLVRNLKYQTSPDRVREVFSAFGPIRDVYLPLDYHTRRPRGFGFVEFYDEVDARRALDEFDQCEVDGNRVEVTLAQRGRSSPDAMREREPFEDEEETFKGDDQRKSSNNRYTRRSRSPIRQRYEDSFQRGKNYSTRNEDSNGHIRYNHRGDHNERNDRRYDRYREDQIRDRYDQNRYRRNSPKRDTRRRKNSYNSQERRRSRSIDRNRYSNRDNNRDYRDNNNRDYRDNNNRDCKDNNYRDYRDNSDSSTEKKKPGNGENTPQKRISQESNESRDSRRSRISQRSKEYDENCQNHDNDKSDDNQTNNRDTSNSVERIKTEKEDDTETPKSRSSSR